MLQITEDTPPDMLAGAMDLTVHLPNGRAVKMAVERSTPMMDLLVQITTNNHLQLSNYTLQALGMAPSSDHSDKILPYKPNTPIGTLDTQHIKVIPKPRTLPVPKNVPPGHQPFESTFRLKVHLPRNQLYVTRVSRNVLLEDIMKKVCEEKNLDPVKYEFKHPGNLDEVLDPKLTLSDYQITEIYVVAKGTSNLTQAFSSNDIMALRKEEERKQMHNKTGGGVFNLIFRKGKSSMGSGSISSDTRSISPTHSDDSRSVTPPAIQQKIITSPKKEPPPPERPKPPQRKRRPAPKPPALQQSEDNNRRLSEEIRRISEETQRPSEETRRSSEESHRLSIEETRRVSEESRRVSEESRTKSEDSRIKMVEEARRHSEEKPSSNISEVSELQCRKTENGLTICHSRNSSDSSGYHEASVLSENGNTSLPRRPKSAFVTAGDLEKVSKMHSQSTTNLSKMSCHSKSTTSLGLAGRKKKAAPPPPPTIRASNPSINVVEIASPVVVASQTPVYQQKDITEHGITKDTLVKEARPNPTPKPRTRPIAPKITTPEVPRRKPPPKPERTHILEEEETEETVGQDSKAIMNTNVGLSTEMELNKELEHNTTGQSSTTVETVDPKESQPEMCLHEGTSAPEFMTPKTKNEPSETRELLQKLTDRPLLFLSEANRKFSRDEEDISQDHLNQKVEQLHLEPQRFSGEDLEDIPPPLPETEPPEDDELESIADIPKKANSETRSHRKGEERVETSVQKISTSSASKDVDSSDVLSDLNEDLFSKPSSSCKREPNRNVYNQLYGIHELEQHPASRNNSITSVKSLQILPEFTGGLRKWNNLEELNDLSLASSMGPNCNSWVLGDQSETESFSSQQALDSLASITSSPSLNIAEVKKEDKFFGSTDSGIAQETVEKLSETEEIHAITPPPPPILDDLPPGREEEVEIKNKKFEEEEREELVEKNRISHHQQPKSQTRVDIPCTEDFEAEERLIEPIIVPKEFTDPKPIEETDDIDWQYQIPSPPKAFRDSSPAYFNDTPRSDCKDSVVTSPELFEKLKTIEDHQFDKETITSDVSSVVSEEEKPLCNNLSLENLEKRKSLVYNRELTTSLKMSEGEIIPIRSHAIDTFSSSLSKFESTFIEIQKSSHAKDVQDSKYVHQRSTVQTTNTLPNFKISTYDKPKQKIKVFEDDTVRSNTDNFSKVQKPEPPMKKAPALSRSFLGRSMENIAFRPPRDSSLNHVKEEKEYRYARKDSSNEIMQKNFNPMSSVFRSESFSAESNWSPSRPVSRSRSQVSLNANKHKEKQCQNDETNISRSNSLYDGLQSLGVMRLIQNKLSTPTSSMENLNQYNKYKNSSYKKPESKMDAISNQIITEPQIITTNTTTSKPILKETVSTQETVSSRIVSTTKTVPDSVPTKSTTTVTTFAESLPPKEELPKPAPEKIYKYRGPPSISVSTWSERPKVPVNIKEDSDYKLSNHNVNSKLIVSTTNNDITSNNSVEVRNNFNSTNSNINNSSNNQVKDSRGVSIKVNGTEPSSDNQYQSGSNVVIKIGSANGDTRPKTIDNQRFISHTTATGYRKPFSTISNNPASQRPHSIAFDSEFDISRVPVVRSFELKKPYKDMGNTSVTQIYHEDDRVGKASTLGRTEGNSELSSRFASMQNKYREPEETSELAKKFATLNNRHSSYSSSNSQDLKDSKPVYRVNSFKPVGSTPVVRGFKQTTNEVNSNNRNTWNGSNVYNTLPAKNKEVVPEQNHVVPPYLQPNLRKAETKKFNSNQDDAVKVSNGFHSLPSVQKTGVKAPPPPLMPKNPVARKPIEPVVDQRDQLLCAIRNFGGKKGLKATKA